MKNFLVSILVILVFSSTASADTIHLKSGKILDGIVMDREKSDPYLLLHYCMGDDQVLFWQKGMSGRSCLEKSDIVEIVKETKKPWGPALLVQDHLWGKERNGFRAQLIQASEQYILGQPMKFHLVTQNVSDKLRSYDGQALAHPTLHIIGPDGKKIEDKVGSFSTVGWGKPIDSGEIVALYHRKDITKEYVMTDLGMYSIQMPGGWWGEPSNVIEFEILPGQPIKDDVLITSLRDNVPDECNLHTGYIPYNRIGLKGVTIAINCIGNHYNRGDSFLWAMDDVIDLEQEDVLEITENIEYLGENDLGHLYFFPLNVPAKKWPNIKTDIIKSLNPK